jgi:hypothetical protein
MTVENPIRLLAAGRPDRDPSIGSRCRHASILQEGDRVHRAGVKAKDLVCGFGLERPSDGGGVEAARSRTNWWRALRSAQSPARVRRALSTAHAPAWNETPARQQQCGDLEPD